MYLRPCPLSLAEVFRSRLASMCNTPNQSFSLEAKLLRSASLQPGNTKAHMYLVKPKKISLFYYLQQGHKINRCPHLKLVRCQSNEARRESWLTDIPLFENNLQMKSQRCSRLPLDAWRWKESSKQPWRNTCSNQTCHVLMEHNKAQHHKASLRQCAFHYISPVWASLSSASVHHTVQKRRLLLAIWDKFISDSYQSEIYKKKKEYEQ